MTKVDHLGVIHENYEICSYCWDHKWGEIEVPETEVPETNLPGTNGKLSSGLEYKRLASGEFLIYIPPNTTLDLTPIDGCLYAAASYDGTHYIIGSMLFMKLWEYDRRMNTAVGNSVDKPTSGREKSWCDVILNETVSTGVTQWRDPRGFHQVVNYFKFNNGNTYFECVKCAGLVSENWLNSYGLCQECSPTGGAKPTDLIADYPSATPNTKKPAKKRPDYFELRNKWILTGEIKYKGQMERRITNKFLNEQGDNDLGKHDAEIPELKEIREKNSYMSGPLFAKPYYYWYQREVAPITPNRALVFVGNYVAWSIVGAMISLITGTGSLFVFIPMIIGMIFIITKKRGS